jgi:hypothetical protein
MRRSRTRPKRDRRHGPFRKSSPTPSRRGSVGVSLVVEHSGFQSLRAAGTLALRSFDGASAQAAKRIEQIDPALDKIISTSEPIKELASGFGGDLGPA